MTPIRQAAPAMRTVRRVEQGRLAYYRSAADAAYWDAHWQASITPALYAELHLGYEPFETIFTRHLPRAGRILEAGCGPGRLVLALRARGYDVEGVDWAADTVARARRLQPDLPIRQEDVCALDVADGYYAAYISLGVIEHRREGPEPFLREALRVLAPGGIAIVSVPWFNPVRRVKAWLGLLGPSDPAGLAFYQYAYGARDVKQRLGQAGFQVIADGCTANIRMGFEDELPWLRAAYGRGRLGRGIRRIVNRILSAVPLFGHSRWFVCRKPQTGPGGAS